MLYSTIVQRDESGFQQIYEGAKRFEEENAMEGIIACKFNMYKVKQTLNLVRMYQQRLNLESSELVVFSETFIEQYSTDNNHCFRMAERLIRKFGTTVTGSMKLFRKFCPVVRKRLEGSDNIVPALDYTKLTQRQYSGMLFGVEPYVEAVKTLLHELAAFFYYMVATLKVCKDMIRKEEEVRGDYSRLKQIFEQSCKEVLKSVVDINETFGSVQLVSQEELERRRRNARPMQEWLAREYHNRDKRWLRREAYILKVSAGREEGLDDIMSQLFSHDYKRGAEVLKAFSRFDTLGLPVNHTRIKGKKGKYNGMELVYFLKWSGVSWLDSQGHWVNEENEKKLYVHLTQKLYKGNYEFPSWQAVCRQRAYCYEHFDLAEMVKAFDNYLHEETNCEVDATIIQLPRQDVG